MFVDPEEEKRQALEKEKQQKKKEIPMIKLKDGSMIPSTALGASAMINPSATATGANRLNYLQ